jgi:hypothetical protein
MLPADCFAMLRERGLLLKFDPKLPSVTNMVAGGPIRGSWWAHPAAHEIVRILSHLAGHPDVLLMKLIAGKDTFVHRCLWPDVWAIATAGEPWQWKRLTAEEHALWRRLQEEGAAEAAGLAAKRLELRLLVHGEQCHSETGEHRRRLERWDRWARRVGFTPEAGNAAGAKRTLQDLLPEAKWPWPTMRLE